MDYRKNITQEIMNLRLQYADQLGLNPMQINNGECMNFADDIVDMDFGKSIWGGDLWECFWSDDIKDILDEWTEFYADGHCFIMYKEKFYDSECPQGCEYADDLPFYQRQKKFINEQNCEMIGITNKVRV